MKGSSNDNGKVSDSGYTNTCVSQSQKSSDSSLSRNSNRSESSGYCGGHPTAFDSSNYALPRPISKDKEHKKKTRTSSAALTTVVADLGTDVKSGVEQIDVGSYDAHESSSDFSSLCKKSEEVARVESIDATDLGEHNGDSNSTDPEGGVGAKANSLDDTSSNNNEGFCAIISLYNGLVVETTPGLETILGYTRDEWLGQSFIDFVHPKDKSTFDDHLAENIPLPYGDDESEDSEQQTSLFCSLRKRDNGRSGTGSGSNGSSTGAANTSLYCPFHLTTRVKIFRGCTDDNRPRMMLLAITARQILHVYKAPEETIISTIFSTRHDPNCILTHVDPTAVQYLGYLPQDMVGRSLFDFYHPEDLPFIKEIYETVVKMKGSPFRSKPYRFATQNGGYVVLETEWTSFVNPWREKLEIIVGHHRILRGPANPDVFQPADDCQRSLLANISEEVFKESKIIQGEIRALLDERISRSDRVEAFKLKSRSKDLVTFVENLMQQQTALCSKEKAPADYRSFSEPDGVMLGEISPHHEYCDSKSSTETPPSYNQLNYNEKIERFFKSKPLLAGYGSDEDNINSSGPSNDDNINSNSPSNEDIDKSSRNLTGTKDTTPNGSGGSGSGIGENLSSGANNRTSYESCDDSDNARNANTMQPESFKLPTLTASLLNKHNMDMEKLMAQQHKERRCTTKNHKLLNESRQKGATKKSTEKGKGQKKNRCGKRCSSRSPERKRSKVFKYDENARTCNAASVPPHANAPVNAMSVDDYQSGMATDRANANVWPSVAVAVPTQPPSHFCMAAQNSRMQEASRCPALPSMIPVYYFPVPQVRDDVVNSMAERVSNQYQQNPCAPIATVIYPPLICAPTSALNMYRPFVTPGPAPVHRELLQPNFNINQQENTNDRKCPPSLATSVKAEPGSTMSESSKKPLSPGQHFSSCVSIDGGCSSVVPNAKRDRSTNSQFESSLEDTSDSSFYGSFLNTSSDSSCIPNKNAKASKKTLWKPAKIEKEQRALLQQGPPWQDGVKITNELIYQYQIKPKPLNEVLEADLKVLKTFNQPQMVNDQLAQLYADMGIGGSDPQFLLADGISSSDSKNRSCTGDPLKIMSEPERQRYDSMMSIMYEENAPLPSP